MIIESKGLRVDTDAVTWHKSTRSSGNCDNCVEVATIDAGVAVRDSKNRDAGVLLFDDDEWSAFVGGVRDGEFDV